MATAALIAPLTCTRCHAPIELRYEVPDRDANGQPVAVGILRCRTGHSWIDIRPIALPRPHPYVADPARRDAPAGQLPLPLEVVDPRAGRARTGRRAGGRKWTQIGPKREKNRR